MNIKKIIILILVFSLTVFTACGGQDTVQEADNEGPEDVVETEKDTSNGKDEDDTLTVAIEMDITALDPAGHNETITAYVTNMITSRLFTYDEDMNTIPQLAEEWEYLSDTELKIKIFEGVKFHDGS